jgi:ABC-type Fe3+-hydroxamate transport system substrate-binding protein
MKRSLRLDQVPRRIISLVPSQTELLYSLGLEDEVIGITRFCIHPESWYQSKIRIGGTKKLNLEKIRSLKPDLLIGNKEENERSQIESLMEEYPVWMSDISNLTEALDMISQVGRITGKSEKAKSIRGEIQSKFSALPSPTHTRSAAYFIWKNPYMAAGHGTFINNMLPFCGLHNAFSQSRYPEISAETLKEVAPEVILLSSEPYPFRDKHITEFKELCPDSEIRIVDGEFFSWYGSRMLDAPSYFRSLFFREIL